MFTSRKLENQSLLEISKKANYLSEKFRNCAKKISKKEKLLGRKTFNSLDQLHLHKSQTLHSLIFYACGYSSLEADHTLHNKFQNKCTHLGKGEIKEREQEKMPIESTATVWRALLGACSNKPQSHQLLALQGLSWRRHSNELLSFKF